MNLAVDRDRIIEEAVFGRAQPLAGLTPPAVSSPEYRFSPTLHDPDRAAELWREAANEAGAAGHPLRLAAMGELETAAGLVAEDLREALGIEVEVEVYSGADQPVALRRLIEKRLPQRWDVLLYDWSLGQTIDAPPLELHRGFVGASGEFRAGPVVPGFEDLYDEFVRQTDPAEQAELSYRIDRFVSEEALVLSLYAPQDLYAVNQQVDFTPYRTTFELAECRVSPEHWSRRDA